MAAKIDLIKRRTLARRSSSDASARAADEACGNRVVFRAADRSIQGNEEQTYVRSLPVAWYPVGFANSGGLVFVDESAEEIAAA